jgi:ADP-ribosylglycohydrolase
MTDLKDRIIGSVVGLAVGDALGAPLEGKIIFVFY